MLNNISSQCEIYNSVIVFVTESLTLSEKQGVFTDRRDAHPKIISERKKA